ncbi:MAG: NAD(P)/FAD-dependent oxidoreductase [Proteobacteria bacterium]|nr:NAD(P)/FAD-dependent oxidoreductase [Pseudomonadota bacterium]
MEKIDVIIIGAGAAGLMCGIEAGKRGRKVLILDHANKAGKKILMSGGGRCNFTNQNVTPENFISHNPHFCKSALSRYTPWDFINLVKQFKIPFHEKTLGQLFCDHKSQDILDMLLSLCEQFSVEIYLNTKIENIEKLSDHHFKIKSNRGDFHCQSLVVATGGLSIPTMGASPFGYQIAEQFGIKVFPTRAALVPFTLQPEDKEKLSPLSGIAIESVVSNERKSFHENILFTHRGMSGPAILQISSYWQPGEAILINMLPKMNIVEHLIQCKQTKPKKQLKSLLIEHLPKRLVETFINVDLLTQKLISIPHQELLAMGDMIHTWSLKPNGTEGYRTAEVTLGGVDCDAISSKTMEVKHISGLYFIGEVLDVTGWLGGFNFQWAWSSGWAAGQYV